MPELIPTRLAQGLQRRTAEHFYRDTATYTTRTASTPNAYGELTYTTSTSSISCSFTDTVSAEDWRDYADVENIDGEVRFSAVTPNKKDTIVITGRFGQSAFVDRTYEIVGIKDRGAFGYVCALRDVNL